MVSFAPIPSGVQQNTSSGSHREGVTRIMQDRGVGFSASIMPDPVLSSFCRLPFSWSCCKNVAAPCPVQSPRVWS